MLYVFLFFKSYFVTYCDYIVTEDLTVEYNTIMLIIDNYDAALQHSQINNDINVNSENGDFDIVDKLLLQLETIDIDDSMIQKCFAFAENIQQLIEKLKLFENKLKTVLTKFLKEKKRNLYDQHRELMKNISNKILKFNSKQIGLIGILIF